jgi:mannose-6-phosphate isomerase-like protein (cupin superfamily)
MADGLRLPGAIGASHLRVYDSVGPDGLAGGTPHLHTLCTEAYYVLGGQGSVQTLTGGGYEETTLTPGRLVWFGPGTIHRLVNDGDLELLVLMSNDGLPEAGDLVVTLPPEVLADRAAYEAVAVLPEDDRTTEGPGTAARVRRDAAVAAFLVLRDACARGDGDTLAAFHAAAVRLVQPRLAAWRTAWEEAALAEALRTGASIEAMAAEDATHLGSATVRRLDRPEGVRRMGCCGTLGTLVP